MAPIYWPNTNRLTLSVQHASELELLLKRNVTPVLEHLTVTIEQTDLVTQRSTSRAHLCEQTLRQKADATRLRSLFIRDMAFEDLIVLLDSLSMPVLEHLTLIDIYGQSKSSTSVRNRRHFRSFLSLLIDQRWIMLVDLRRSVALVDYQR